MALKSNVRHVRIANVFVDAGIVLADSLCVRVVVVGLVRGAAGMLSGSVVTGVGSSIQNQIQSHNFGAEPK